MSWVFFNYYKKAITNIKWIEIGYQIWRVQRPSQTAAGFGDGAGGCAAAEIAAHIDTRVATWRRSTRPLHHARAQKGVLNLIYFCVDWRF